VYGVRPIKIKTEKKGKSKMKSSVYKSYDELPLFLNSDTVAKTLGIAPSSAYELMHEKNFPTLRVGSRMVVPKEKFIQWVEEHTKGGARA
jgi:excisionase family DNA binding protein